MSTIDWPALLLGLLLGMAVSSLFFIGLAWGIKRALTSARPTASLFTSFVLRMGLLLGVGFGIAAVSASLWPIIGYVAAFFMVRLLAIHRARVSTPPQADGRKHR